MSSDAQQTRFRVAGMDCASCATKIETATRRIAGVEDVSVSVVSGTMTVQHSSKVDLKKITDTVGELGYAASPLPAAGAPSMRSKSAPAEKSNVSMTNADAGGSHTHLTGPEEQDHQHGDHADHDHGGHDGGQKPSKQVRKDELDGMHGHDHAAEDGPWWKTSKARLTILCGVAVAAAFAVAKVVPSVESWAFIAAMVVGLFPIARRALFGAIHGSPFSIETLMTVAAVGAVIIGASEEAAVVVLLFLVGELLEGIATGRARASIKALTKLVPKRALLEVDGRTSEVDAESVEVGATLLVRPGDRVPADGIILSGESAIDEAPVTGESVPKRKVVDDQVFAGTVNQEGTLRIRVTAAAADNTIARVVKLVEEAQESKAPTERFIDRFARYYTPGVMFVAALIAVVPPLVMGGSWGEWIYKGLAVLLIGCPCALVISTPAAIAAALSAGARRGLLMKGGAVLEQLGKINQVALDKTGTLTMGRPKVTDVIGFGLDEDDVIGLAAALEAGSSHPLASAVLAKAKERNIESRGAAEGGALGGKGVTGTVNGKKLFLGSPKAAAELASLSSDLEAAIAKLNVEGKTVSVLVVDGNLSGLIAMRDEPREDAAEGLRALKALGADLVMLTGDNKRTAASIGRLLDIEVRADLLPEDKQRIVGELRKAGKIVAKVGDGINDAPALAAADVGIAMGGGTDAALETADAAILHGRVIDIANMITLSRTTMNNIIQNISISLGLKAVFLVTTVIGVTGLWPAILADTGATVLVTANAMRLLAWRGIGRKN